MAKILILIGAHLCTAPRPQKEAETLAGAGHEVTVRGIWHDPLYADRDRDLMVGRKWKFRPVVDFRPNSWAGRGRGFGVRARRRVALELQARFGKFTPSLLAYGVGAMLKAALEERADLTIVHSEGGLWVGGRLLDEGLRVGVDYEDWFSEDLLPEARKSRPIAQLKALEGRLMREASYRLTTSHVLARALSEAYGAPKPSVLYNAFPFAERASLDGQIRDRMDTAVPSLHWFSQTIGPGRGLEQLFEALKYVPYPAELHLRGNCSAEVRRWVESSLPPEWKERVFLHQTVANAELLSRIYEHDIGLALEMPYCLSRQFTVTNKMFQYMQAGLAVVASDTPGQKEILAKCPAAGQMVAANDPRALARAITFLIGDEGRLSASKRAGLDAARDLFSWEGQAEVVLREADRALSTRPGGRNG